jgi:hypothetical protein
MRGRGGVGTAPLVPLKVSEDPPEVGNLHPPFFSSFKQDFREEVIERKKRR